MQPTILLGSLVIICSSFDMCCGESQPPPQLLIRNIYSTSPWEKLEKCNFLHTFPSPLAWNPDIQGFPGSFLAGQLFDIPSPGRGWSGFSIFVYFSLTLEWNTWLATAKAHGGRYQPTGVEKAGEKSGQRPGSEAGSLETDVGVG